MSMSASNNDANMSRESRASGASSTVAERGGGGTSSSHTSNEANGREQQEGSAAQEKMSAKASGKRKAASLRQEVLMCSQAGDGREGQAEDPKWADRIWRGRGERRGTGRSATRQNSERSGSIYSTVHF
eukprot:4686441-Prymnesium_polylepis.1